MKNSWIFKSVAFFTAFCLLMTQIGMAAPEIRIAKRTETPAAPAFSVPEELAHLEKLHHSQENSRMIIQIQNAHANENAQFKIQELLQFLNQNYGIRTVFIEGAAEQLNPDYLEFSFDKKKNQAILNELVKEGVLDGPGLFIQNRVQGVQGLPIEDIQLYRKNYEALKTVFGAQSKIDSMLGKIESRISKKVSTELSSELRAAVTQWQSFEKGQRAFLPYVNRLTEKAHRVLGLDFENVLNQAEWKQLPRLLAIQKIEKKLSIQKALEEKASLLSFLRSKRISKTFIDSIDQSFAEGKMISSTSLRRLMEELVQSGESLGLDLRNWPAFTTYAAYLILKQELDAPKLMEEIERVFAQMIQVLAKTSEEKQLLVLIRDFSLLTKLLHLELSRTEFSKIEKRKVTPETITKKLGISLDVSLRSIYQSALKFYRYALERDQMFYEKMNRQMNEKGIAKAAIVTGGFHAEGLSRLLEANQTNFAVLTPRIGEISDSKLYHDVMLGNKAFSFAHSFLPQAALAQRPVTLKRMGFGHFVPLLNSGRHRNAGTVELAAAKSEVRRVSVAFSQEIPSLEGIQSANLPALMAEAHAFALENKGKKVDANEITRRAQQNPFFVTGLNITSHPDQDGTVLIKSQLNQFTAPEENLTHPEYIGNLIASLEGMNAAIKAKNDGKGVLQMIHTGQGGSSATGNVLRFLGTVPELYVLDHTDPAAFNAMLLAITKIAPYQAGNNFDDWKASLGEAFKKILPDLLLVPMALGATSEEAVINLAVLYSIAEELGLDEDFKHQIWALTLDNSSVHNAMKARGFGDQMMQLQLNGEQAVPGRGAGPAATPIAFYPLYFHALQASQNPEDVLRNWNEGARLSPESLQVFQSLALLIDQHVRQGKNKITLVLPPKWKHLEEWIKQIMEESEGVDRKDLYNQLLGRTGFDRSQEPEFKIITSEQNVDPRYYRDPAESDRVFLVLNVEGEALSGEQQSNLETLRSAGHPIIDLNLSAEHALPTVMQGFHHVAATLIGYLWKRNFITQPSVEKYKAVTKTMIIEAMVSGGFLDSDEAAQDSKTYFDALVAWILREDRNNGSIQNSKTYQEIHGKETIAYQSTWGNGNLGVYFNPKTANPDAIQEEIASFGGDLNSAVDRVAAVIRLEQKKKDRHGLRPMVEIAHGGDLDHSEDGQALAKIVDGVADAWFRLPYQVPVDITSVPKHLHSTHEAIRNQSGLTVLFVPEDYSESFLGNYSTDYIRGQVMGAKGALEEVGRTVVMIKYPKNHPQGRALIEEFQAAVSARLASARSEVRFSTVREYFPGIEKIEYEGQRSTNSMAFKWYDPERVIGGKKMKDFLKITVAYWHTFKGKGGDIFGPGTQKRPWDEGDATTNEGRMSIAMQTMDAAFEFFVKMGATHWTFHDRDISPEAYINDDPKQGIDVERTRENLRIIVEYAKQKQEETGLKLLWGTANVFSHPRFMSGAGSNPNFDVVAHAAAQIRAAMEATMILGGENYVFWGGREGYATLHNTNMKLEKKHIAELMKLAVKYNEELAQRYGRDKLQLLIEPKPHEPTQSQYDFDTGNVVNFLYANGLEKEFKLNIEANHATLAKHSFQHELQAAQDAGMLGSIDINQGDPNTWWDTDHFAGFQTAVEAMLVVLAQGGLGKGGFNFDAKVRRESTDLKDLFYAHIGGIDALAKAFIVAYRIYTETDYLDRKHRRYASFATPKGRQFSQGKLKLQDLEEYAILRGEPDQISGREEKLTALVEHYMAMPKKNNLTQNFISGLITFILTWSVFAFFPSLKVLPLFSLGSLAILVGIGTVFFASKFIFETLNPGLSLEEIVESANRPYGSEYDDEDEGEALNQNQPIVPRTDATEAARNAAVSHEKREYFSTIQKIKYEGEESDNPLAFKWYDPERVIGGKKMKDFFKMTVAYWHTFKGRGGDPFGPGTQVRPWDEGDDTTNEGRMKIAKQTMDAAFEFFVKIGATHWTFHDRDIAPEAYFPNGGIDVVQTRANLMEMVQYAKQKQEETGLKLLWGTANVFSNPRFMSGAGSNPNFDVLAHAGAQIRAAMEATKILGGENYVFWGGREGYATLHNTNMKLEKEHIAMLMKMAVQYNEELVKQYGGEKLQLLIEPKPHEPTQSQYDFDVQTVLGFLRKNGLEKEFKLNVEANHATLAKHSFRHELQAAQDADALGSIDINQGEPLTGWDTDHFAGFQTAVEALLVVLAQGGLGKGGFNFDAKVRRESTDLEDLFHAHIRSMDALARALIVAYRIYTETDYIQQKKDRYASFNSEEGQRFERGESSLVELENHAIQKREPTPRSGREEALDGLVQRYEFMSGEPKSAKTLEEVQMAFAMSEVRNQKEEVDGGAGPGFLAEDKLKRSEVRREEALRDLSKVKEAFYGVNSSTQSFTITVGDGQGVFFTHQEKFEQKKYERFGSPEGFSKAENAKDANRFLMNPLMIAFAIEESIKALQMFAKERNLDLSKLKAGAPGGQQHALIYLTKAARTGFDPSSKKSLEEQIRDGGFLAWEHSAIWKDKSTDPEGKEVVAAFGSQKALLEETGSEFQHRFAAGQIAKFAKEHPEKYRNTDMILTLPAFVGFLLTGKADFPWDAGEVVPSHLGDLKSKDWLRAEKLDKLVPGLSGKIPTVEPTDSLVTLISPYWAKYGFSKKSLVANGTGDNPANLIGMGMLDSDMTLSLGTSFVVSKKISTLADVLQALESNIGNMMGGPAALAEWMKLVCFQNGGLALKRIRDLYISNDEAIARLGAIGIGGILYSPEQLAQLQPDERADKIAAAKWEIVEEEISKTKPGNGGAMIITQSEDEKAFEVKFKKGFPYSKGNLNLQNRRQVLRAAVEGQIYFLKYAAQRAGLKVDEIEQINLTGGAAKNATIRQIIANIFDAEVYVLEDGIDSVSLGMLVNARRAYSRRSGSKLISWRQASKNLVRLKKNPTRPDAESVKTYQKFFPRFQAMVEEAAALAKFPDEDFQFVDLLSSLEPRKVSKDQAFFQALIDHSRDSETKKLLRKLLKNLNDESRRVLAKEISKFALAEGGLKKIQALVAIAMDTGLRISIGGGEGKRYRPEAPRKVTAKSEMRLSVTEAAQALTKQMFDLGHVLSLDLPKGSDLLDGTLDALIQNRIVYSATTNNDGNLNYLKEIGTDALNAEVKAILDEGKIRDRNEVVRQAYENLINRFVAQLAIKFLPIYRDTKGRHGFVSTELPTAVVMAKEGDFEVRVQAVVDAALARFKATQDEIVKLHGEATRNLLIKIPATDLGLEAGKRLIAQGVNVNFTLVATAEQYEATVMAHKQGLMSFVETHAGIALNDFPQSVSSDFVSRDDRNVAPLLDSADNFSKLIAHMEQVNDPAQAELLAQYKALAALDVSARQSETDYSQRLGALQALRGEGPANTSKAAVAFAHANIVGLWKKHFEGAADWQEFLVKNGYFGLDDPNSFLSQQIYWASTGVKEGSSYTTNPFYLGAVVMPNTTNTVPRDVVLALAQSETAPFEPKAISPEDVAAGQVVLTNLASAGIHLGWIKNNVIFPEGLKAFDGSDSKAYELLGKAYDAVMAARSEVRQQSGSENRELSLSRQLVAGRFPELADVQGSLSSSTQVALVSRTFALEAGREEIQAAVEEVMEALHAGDPIWDAARKLETLASNAQTQNPLLQFFVPSDVKAGLVLALSQNPTQAEFQEIAFFMALKTGMHVEVLVSGNQVSSSAFDSFKDLSGHSIADRLTVTRVEGNVQAAVNQRAVQLSRSLGLTLEQIVVLAEGDEAALSELVGTPMQSLLENRELASARNFVALLAAELGLSLDNGVWQTINQQVSGVLQPKVGYFSVNSTSLWDLAGWMHQIFAQEKLVDAAA